MEKLIEILDKINQTLIEINQTIKIINLKQTKIWKLKTDHDAVAEFKVYYEMLGRDRFWKGILEKKNLLLDKNEVIKLEPEQLRNIFYMIAKKEKFNDTEKKEYSQNWFDLEDFNPIQTVKKDLSNIFKPKDVVNDKE